MNLPKMLSFRLSILILILSAGLAGTSCRKTDYPCPGLGRSNEADISMFDENGQLKQGKSNTRVNRDTGLINKKKPKQLQYKRKRHL